MTEAERKRMREIIAEETEKFLRENRTEIVKRAEKRIKDEKKHEAQLPELS